MNALERIRSMEHGTFKFQDERVEFLLRAVRVYRELAEQFNASYFATRKYPIVPEAAANIARMFEERMKGEEE